MAKGAQRTSPSLVQRYSGGFDLLTRGEAVGMIRPHGQLTTLTEWDLQASHHHLRADLDGMRLGLYAADLANALIADHDPHTASFDAMVSAAKRADILIGNLVIESDKKARKALELLVAEARIDGEIVEEERELLIKIGERLKITGDDFQAIYRAGIARADKVRKSHNL